MKLSWVINIILLCLAAIIINSGCTATTAGLGQSPELFQKCNEGLILDCWYSRKEITTYDKNGQRQYNPPKACRCVKPGDDARFYMTHDEINYYKYNEP